MTAAELVKANREAIIRIAAERGATNVRVFGSVARGDAQDESDVDFLVDLEAGRSLLDLAGLMLDLEELLGRHVDVGTAGGLKERYRERILAEAAAI